MLSSPTWMRGGRSGHLVDGEYAAVGARHDAVVDHALVGVGQALGGRLDRIDVADQVGDGHVRGGQLSW